jgi:hypothetical protein
MIELLSACGDDGAARHPLGCAQMQVTMDVDSGSGGGGGGYGGGGGGGEAYSGGGEGGYSGQQQVNPVLCTAQQQHWWIGSAEPPAPSTIPGKQIL